MDERRAALALPLLGRLGALRERRALEALRAAEEALAKARTALEDQRRLIGGIEAELAALVERSSAGPPSVESLRLAADRRHWLHYDLDMERYYIETFESDVAAAEASAATARGLWRREREKGVALASRAGALRREAVRRAEARAGAAEDDAGGSVRR